MRNSCVAFKLLHPAQTTVIWIHSKFTRNLGSWHNWQIHWWTLLYKFHCHCNESMFSLNPVPEVYESLTVTYAVVSRGPSASGGGSSLIHSPAHSPTPQPSTKFVCVARKTSSVVPTVASSSTGSPSMVGQSKETKCSSHAGLFFWTLFLTNQLN